MNARFAFALALALAGLAFSAGAAAGEDEVSTLETKLTAESKELSTSDCAAACKALASIRRAADRICDLEPGPRCDAAQSKAEDATRRVRAACPECVVATLKKKQEQDENHAAAPTADAPEAAPMAKSEPRGGCRSCATTPSNAPDAGDLCVFVLAFVVVVGRRRRR